MFSLGGTGYEVTRLIRDKLAMRQYLAERDPDAVGAASLVDRADLDAFAAKYGVEYRHLATGERVAL